MILCGCVSVGNALIILFVSANPIDEVHQCHPSIAILTYQMLELADLILHLGWYPLGVLPKQSRQEAMR